MNPDRPNLFVSFEGFAPRAELTDVAEIKVTRLRRHRHPRIGDVRMHVKHEGVRHPLFHVCAMAESPGVEFIAHHESPEPEMAIAEAFAKLERTVAGAAGVRKHRRHLAGAKP